MVVLVHALDVGADGLDDPRSLVAEDAGQGHDVPIALHHVPVGVADAARHDFHEHLAGPGLRYLDGLHLDGLFDFMQDGGFHASASSGAAENVRDCRRGGSVKGRAGGGR